MKIRSLLIAVALTAGGTVQTAQAADTGTLTRAESLREKPFADAKVLAPATAGSKVDIITRNGGWYQVKTAGKTGKTGWVRMLSVRRSAAPAGTSTAGIAAVASGRTGTGTVVTTTGVRGLDAKEMSAAAFDEAQIAQAEKNRVSSADAAAFAKLGGLAVRDAAPLPAPKKPAKK